MFSDVGISVEVNSAPGNYACTIHRIEITGLRRGGLMPSPAPRMLVTVETCRYSIAEAIQATVLPSGAYARANSSAAAAAAVYSSSTDNINGRQYAKPRVLRACSRANSRTEKQQRSS